MSGCRAPKANGLGDLNPIQRGTTAAIHKRVSLVSFRNSAVAEPRSAKPIEAYASLPPGVVELCSDMPRAESRQARGTSQDHRQTLCLDQTTVNSPCPPVISECKQRQPVSLCSDGPTSKSHRADITCDVQTLVTFRVREKLEIAIKPFARVGSRPFSTAAKAGGERNPTGRSMLIVG
jgi:hypothetical protein